VTERLLNADELGRLLGLSKGTILDRWERGDLPGFRLFGRKGGPVRFRLSEIEETLQAWRINGPGARGEVSPTPSTLPARGVVSQASPTPVGGEMYDQTDLEQLVRAARNAATKMKIEYDRLEPDAKAGECWAECEALWDALVPFAEVGSDA
jgi:predicted DNA-binding transcriptional regulator AlpA